MSAFYIAALLTLILKTRILINLLTNAIQIVVDYDKIDNSGANNKHLSQNLEHAYQRTH